MSAMLGEIRQALAAIDSARRSYVIVTNEADEDSVRQAAERIPTIHDVTVKAHTYVPRGTAYVVDETHIAAPLTLDYGGTDAV